MLAQSNILFNLSQLLNSQDQLEQAATHIESAIHAYLDHEDAVLLAQAEYNVDLHTVATGKRARVSVVICGWFLLN